MWKTPMCIKAIIYLYIIIITKANSQEEWLLRKIVFGRPAFDTAVNLNFIEQILSKSFVRQEIDSSKEFIWL